MKDLALLVVASFSASREAGDYSDNVTSADNQQERLPVECVPENIGNFLSGFMLGEGSFMVVCRQRKDGRSSPWSIHPAFNVSQHDRAPLELIQQHLGCGSIRRGGKGGWYFEVDALADILEKVIPFFERFPLVGKKQEEFERFRSATMLLAAPPLTYSGLVEVLTLREGMNGGGKRRHSMERILRDYTPDSFSWPKPRRRR